MNLPIDRSIKEYAAGLVNDWRANDGGLTEAACEVIYLGGCCDKLVRDSSLSRDEVIDILQRWSETCSTGAENDVIDRALELV